mmetsp:Transcript_35793/g.91408  ORF Transcript_35793/g.91408 Transcript_35793/m.91408 type:complete len:394 (+) Transcript_35793:796-1977(+)
MGGGRHPRAHHGPLQGGARQRHRPARLPQAGRHGADALQRHALLLQAYQAAGGPSAAHRLCLRGPDGGAAGRVPQRQPGARHRGGAGRVWSAARGGGRHPGGQEGGDQAGGGRVLALLQRGPVTRGPGDGAAARVQALHQQGAAGGRGAVGGDAYDPRDDRGADPGPHAHLLQPRALHQLWPLLLLCALLHARVPSGGRAGGVRPLQRGVRQPRGVHGLPHGEHRPGEDQAAAGEVPGIHPSAGHSQEDQPQGGDAAAVQLPEGARGGGREGAHGQPHHADADHVPGGHRARGRGARGGVDLHLLPPPGEPPHAADALQVWGGVHRERVAVLWGDRALPQGRRQRGHRARLQLRPGQLAQVGGSRAAGDCGAAGVGAHGGRRDDGADARAAAV